MEQNNKNWANFNWSPFGINLAVGMAVFTILGNLADQKLNSSYLFTIIGIFCGLMYCAYEFWKIIRQSKNESKK